MDATLLEGADDLEARGVADVGETREGVAAEVSLVDEVLRRAVKHGAPLLEFSNTVRGFLGVEFSHSPVGEPLAALHGVVEVDLPTVSRVSVLQGCGTATLGHHRVGFAEQ